MSTTYQYTKQVNPSKLQNEIAAAGIPEPELVSTVDTEVYVRFSAALTAPQQTTLDSVVSDHVVQTAVESLAIYMATELRPFVDALVNTFASENIALGITQAGKTGHLLSLFGRQYPIPNSTYPNSLKACFDTGSLHVAIDIIQYIRDNPTEYSGLDPYVTDGRLAAIQAKISNFLA